ncbi:MAG: hypothetical protein LBS86_03730, partial [Treponema sp.]|nr:hypothetical protein [Treponema sp.]
MSDLLVIALFAVFWYGLVPVIGAFITRASWRRFRRRFDALRLCPMLDYATYERYSRELSPEGGRFRFIGGFESITSNQASRTAPTLWIRAHNLTIPVGLLNARIYLLPLTEQEGREDQSTLIPQRIRWDRVSTLTEGARVFVGGMLALRDDRLMFVATRENPLILIFYDGDDRSLTIRAIRAGRHKNEYWNRVTPYAFILGVFTQLIIALSFLARPAFRFTAVAACIALFIPLFPVVPPGVLFTVVYQRLWRRARRFRAYRDIARLPLKYCANRLPDGERYGASSPTALPDDAEGHIPILIPASRRKKDGWYIF